MARRTRASLRLLAPVQHQRGADALEILEQIVDAAAPGVVRLDQLLELRKVVGARPVGAEQFVELGADGGLEALQFGVPVRNASAAIESSSNA